MGADRSGSTTAVVEALRALGAPLEDERDAAHALAEHRADADRRLAEPVAVAWRGTPSTVPLRTDGPADCTLRTEDGRELAFRAERGVARLPSDLPHGYHTLHVQAADGRSAEIMVLAAPERAPDDGRRRWAVFLPLYALPAPAAVADLGDLAELVRVTAAHGAGLVGTTPLYAAFLDEPCEPSPYAPASRLFWNDLYIDLDALPELERSPAARDALAGAARPGRETIDYAAAAAARRPVLDALADAAFADDGPRRDALEAHLGTRPELAAYAAFRAQREPDPERAGRRHVYAQWVADEQLSAVARDADAAGSGLYLDLPLGVHPDAYDVAAEPEAFAPTMSAGAPPDLLQPAGQDWGLPPLHPTGIRETHHRYTIACLRQAFRHARALRVDHVAGLHRLFWVPRGLPASEGVYVRYPADELYAILLIEAHRRGALVAGEDLGSVPETVREKLRRHGLLRSYVLEFELGPRDSGPARTPPAASIASLDTHDTPPFAAWWRDGEAPADEAAAEARRRLVELARGPARVVLASLEDLWGETRPQNVPGTVGADNWRRRARHGVDLDRVPEALATLRALQEARP
jgi:4-alpha-glucanotransferase